MRQIEPVAAYVPYMTVVGNHEYAYNFSHFINRFTMPNTPHNLFYRFTKWIVWLKRKFQLRHWPSPFHCLFHGILFLLWVRLPTIGQPMALAHWRFGSTVAINHTLYNQIHACRKPIRTARMCHGLSQWVIGQCIVLVHSHHNYLVSF